jgi:Holliday junction resolvase RusA-like endonuclease
MTIHLTIPWEHIVSKNDKFTMWKRGRPALTEKYRTGKEKIREIAAEQYSGDPYSVDMAMEIDLVYPDGRHRDAANFTQIILDGLEGVVYTDDYYVQDMCVRRNVPNKDNPRVEISLWPID